MLSASFITLSRHSDSWKKRFFILIAKNHIEMDKRPRPNIKSFVKAGNARTKGKSPMISGFGNSGAVFGAPDDNALHPQIVKMARKSGQLNLSNKGLSKIPSKVFSLNDQDEDEAKKECQNFNMDTSDGDKWWERADLSKLYLSSNCLQIVDPLIGQLTSLQLLDISDNSLKALPGELGELRHLTKLVLSHNELENLPESIGSLDELQHLALDHNNIQTLPKAVGSLYMLDHLDVSHNKITELPKDIGYLQKLSRFQLADNKLKELVPEIGDLFGLIHLDLSRNELTSIPDELGRLPKLRELYLRQNKIAKFPKFETTSIREIYLGLNWAKKLKDEDFEPLVGLHILDLSQNGIDELPDGVTHMQNLHRLDLTNNYLSNLPYHMGFLAHLKNLTLEGNPLKLIRRDILQRGTSQLLKYLSSKAPQPVNTYPGFSEHVIQNDSENDVRIPDQYEMRNARALVFNHKVATVPDELFKNAGFAKVQTCDLSGNILAELPIRVSDLSGHLQELVLHHNKLTSLPSCLGDLKYLQFLDVQNNFLTDLPDEIRNLVCLREINMAFNKFEHLPEPLLCSTSLEIIFAAENKIREIPVEKMTNMSRLATLDLHNNDISFVPPQMGRMTQLRCVQLEGNAFRVPRAAILAKGTSELLEYLRSRIIDEKP